MNGTHRLPIVSVLGAVDSFQADGSHCSNLKSGSESKGSLEAVGRFEQQLATECYADVERVR